MYICRSCRESLRKGTGPFKQPQSLAKAGFLSLRNPRAATDEPKLTPPQEPSQRKEPFIQNDSHGYQPPSGPQSPRQPQSSFASKVATLLHGRPQGRYSQGPRFTPQSRGGQDLTEGRNHPFSFSIDPNPVLLPSSHDLGPTARQTPRRDVPVADNRLTELKTHLDNQSNASAEDVWEYVLVHFGTKERVSHTRPAFTPVPTSAGGAIFEDVLRKMTNAWCEADTATKLPSPMAVLSKFKEIKVMKPVYYSHAIWSLCTGTLKHLVNNDARRERTMGELLEVWAKFFQEFRSASATNDTAGAWDSLPSLEYLRDSLHQIKGYARRSHYDKFRKDRLQLLIPAYRTPFQNELKLDSALLMTFSFLSQHHQSLLSESQRKEVDPLLNVLGCYFFQDPLVKLLNWIKTDLPNLFPDAESKDIFLGKLEALAQESIKIVATMSGSPSQEHEPQSQQQDIDPIEAFYRKRMARAHEYQRAETLTKLWREIKHMFATSNASSGKKIPLKVYDGLLTSSLSLRVTEMTVEIWNHMIENQVTPNVETWTAMLVGCNKAHDVIALESIWERMHQARCQPDTHAWTVRIHGLISHGRREQGLQALGDMGRIYTHVMQTKNAKQKGKSSTPITVAKPGVETLNAVITSLSRRNHDEDIGTVLKWAQNYDIKPDTGTFNCFINMAFKRNEPEEAFQFLRKMEAAKVEPDVATYTIILDATLVQEDALKQLSEDEKSQYVMDLLKELEAKGLTVNAHVCSTLIDGLLKHQGTIAAAQAVLRYMSIKKINPTPHVYTMLVTHFFNSTPPNIEAVDTLYAHTLQADAVTDLIFYDRIVEGYARCNEVGKMMTALARMSKDAKKPGWPALTAVVEALARDGNVERLRDVINDVKNSKGIVRAGFRDSGRFGRMNFEHRFWSTVRDLGMDFSTSGAASESARVGAQQR